MKHKDLRNEFTERRQRVKQLMEKFDALIDEGIGLAMSGENLSAEENFEAAIDEIADPIQNSAAGGSDRRLGSLERWNPPPADRCLRKFRQLRHRGFVNALYEVERSAIPFPDEPPIGYPDAEFWERISTDRQKYKSIDLLGGDTKERRIYDALDKEMLLEFTDAPLSEVIDYIKTAADIPIIIDKRALDDVGLGSDTPLTVSLNGVTLRSALKLMLKELDLTYVIRDEVLKITTPEEAENELLTKVYAVADLVLPITGGMGGGMGGMMGGMGGGMGGMGGGMGGMGGGMGGMGGGMMGGMGGMGGFFAVEDDLRLGAKSNANESTDQRAEAKPEPARGGRVAAIGPVEPIELTCGEGQTWDDAWDSWLAQHKNDSAQESQMLDLRIRATARELSERREVFGNRGHDSGSSAESAWATVDV